VFAGVLLEVQNGTVTVTVIGFANDPDGYIIEFIEK